MTKIRVSGVKHTINYAQCVIHHDMFTRINYAWNVRHIVKWGQYMSCYNVPNIYHHYRKTWYIIEHINWSQGWNISYNNRLSINDRRLILSNFIHLILLIYGNSGSSFYVLIIEYPLVKLQWHHSCMNVLFNGQSAFQSSWKTEKTKKWKKLI